MEMSSSSCCILCSEIENNVFIEDVFGINRHLIAIFPELKNPCIIKTGNKVCIKCYGKVNRLEQFVSHFRDSGKMTETECCNFCGSDQIFQASIEPITIAVLQSGIWKKDTLPFCCGACFWQIDIMVQLKKKIELITYTVKYKLKRVSISLQRLSSTQVETIKQYLQPTFVEYFRKRKSNIKVTELHQGSSKKTIKKKTLCLAQSPNKISVILDILENSPRTKGARKAFSPSVEAQAQSVIAVVPVVQTSHEKKKYSIKITKKRIQELMALHHIVDSNVMMKKLSNEEIALYSKGQNPSESFALPGVDIFDEPKKEKKSNIWSEVTPLKKKPKGRPPKSTNKKSLLCFTEYIEYILPNALDRKSPLKLPKTAGARKLRKPKIFPSFQMRSLKKRKRSKSLMNAISDSDNGSPVSQISKITKDVNNELLPEQISGITSYLQKHNREFFASNEAFKIVPKDAASSSKLEVHAELEKMSMNFGIIENGVSKSPPPNPMFSSAADPCSMEKSVTKRSQVTPHKDISKEINEVADRKLILKDVLSENQVHPNISFADTHEISMMNESVIKESLADVTPESSPTKNMIMFLEKMESFMNDKLPVTKFKQILEYEELSSDTKLLDE